MDVYLDTSHLQKWCQRTLEDVELVFLDGLRENEEYTFVLSNVHIAEVTARLHHDAALDTGRFLDTLRHKWLRLSNDIFSLEIGEAFEAFKNGSAPRRINTFVAAYVDTLVALDLENYIAYRRTSIEQIISDLLGQQDITLSGSDAWEARLSTWSRVQWRINKLMENWRVSVKRRYGDVTAQILTNRHAQGYAELGERDQAFINALLEKPEWTPSHWITFHSQHQCHRNIGYLWLASDISDVTHLAALPYVDHMTLDRRWYAYACQALRSAPTSSSVRDLSQRLDRSITDLMTR